MNALAPLGVFARTFIRDSAAEVADAVRSVGFDTVQLNLSSMRLPTIPDAATLTRLDLTAIGAAFRDRGISIWGVSLTFNLIHPDVHHRASDLARAVGYLARIAELGGSCATICTGTRDPENMWRAHPDNASAAAWADLRDGLAQLIPAARAAGMLLGIEPEQGNVIVDAATARRLLTELGEDAADVCIVLDPANLLTVDTLRDQRAILGEAFDTLGDAIECVQAKDVVGEGYAAAGAGGLDYDLVFDLWSRLPRPAPMIAQDCTESDAPRVHSMLADHARRHPWRGPE